MHVEFSPSQLARIIACPSSVQLYRELNPARDLQTSSYAEEGTLLHKYSEDVILGLLKIERIENPEHRAMVKAATSYVKEFINDSSTTAHYLEQRVSIADTPVEGTADVIVIQNGAIHVFDYKFGAGVKVDPEENPQFMAYLLGAINTLRLKVVDKSLYVHVVQPRIQNINQWQVSYAHLMVWKQSVLIPAIACAESEKSHFHPSVDACRWCAAKARCKACHAAAQNAAAMVFASYCDARTNKAISVEQLTEFYAQADILEDYIKTVKEYVLSELLAGRKIPGYTIGHGRGRRKYRDEGLAAQFLEGRGLDPEDIYETKIRSLTAIETIDKTLKKDPQWLALLSMSEGPVKVVKDNNSKEAFEEVLEN